MAIEIHLKFPRLHPGQEILRRGRARFNVPCMGRRFGKTTFCLDEIIAEPGGALDGMPVGWFAPNYKYLVEAWREAVRMVEPIIKRRDKSEKRIELITGGVLDFWTLDDPNAGRSRKYAKVVVDEAAHCRNLEEAWQQAIWPTLTDYAGSAWFPSTPCGGNYFKALFDQGDPNHPNRDPEWQSWQMPSRLNPHLPESELAAFERRLPELVYKQEYLAQFVDFAGTLLKREWIRYGHPNVEVVRIGLGVDLAISQKTGADWTAIVAVALGIDGSRWVIDAMRVRTSFHGILQAISQMAEKHNPGAICCEAIQFQAAVVQELLRTTSLPVIPVYPDKDKVTRFMVIQKRYQDGLYHHAPTLMPEFEAELLAFTADDTHDHDDLVDALELAEQAANIDGSGFAVAGRTVEKDFEYAW